MNEESSLEATPVAHAETDHDTISTVTVKRGQEAPDTDVNAFIPPHPAEQGYVAESTEAGAQDYHGLLGEEQSNSSPIHLKLNVRSSEGDQPDFALFGTPDVPYDGDQPPEETLVLLQHHQVLFYEPISTVFDAFRHEGYFNHLEELSNAEMPIFAPDLQLLVSELLSTRTVDWAGSFITSEKRTAADDAGSSSGRRACHALTRRWRDPDIQRS